MIIDVPLLMCHSCGRDDATAYLDRYSPSPRRAHIVDPHYNRILPHHPQVPNDAVNGWARDGVAPWSPEYFSQEALRAESTEAVVLDSASGDHGKS